MLPPRTQAFPPTIKQAEYYYFHITENEVAETVGQPGAQVFPRTLLYNLILCLAGGQLPLGPSTSSPIMV